MEGTARLEEAGVKDSPDALVDDEIANKDHLDINKLIPGRFAEDFDSAHVGLNDPNFGARRQQISIRKQGAT